MQLLLCFGCKRSTRDETSCSEATRVKQIYELKEVTGFDCSGKMGLQVDLYNGTVNIASVLTISIIRQYSSYSLMEQTTENEPGEDFPKNFDLIMDLKRSQLVNSRTSLHL
uniref:Uncharacterized protein n=1 Tax=Megaselia scalaris TaxID=36166 RepID=T1GEQ5_MEGSC